jgi:hypothetical protein
VFEGSVARTVSADGGRAELEFDGVQREFAHALCDIDVDLDPAG